MKKLVIGLFGIILVSVFLTSNTTVEARPIDLSENFATSINEHNSFANVAIFIRFADEASYSAPYGLDHYEDLFNGVDSVSLRDYFLEVSYNQLTIDTYLISNVDSILYYNDYHDRGYFMPYDTNNTIGYEDEDESALREHRLLKDAADWVEDNDLLDDSIDLDINDDGDIDSITFMVSGEDEGWYSLLWPHKWSMNSYYNYNTGNYEYDAPTINGKYVWDYTFELLGDSTEYDNIVEVGVLAHETFHLISAPDLYHYYDYDWIEAVGEWGLMDSVDFIPSHMLGYMKYQYGNWIDEVAEITEPGTYTLYPLQDDASNLYRIPLGYSNEYIYLEYRDNDGFYESTLPGTGLLVYRVDEDFINMGNESGYYEAGYTNEEVWVFRPDMDDMITPIEFDATDPGYDIDGTPNDAAILNTNLYTSIGLGTDILLFDSNGDVLDYVIQNVVEHDGYITFDVLETSAVPTITISGTELDFEDEIIFLDYDNTYYYLTVENYMYDENYRYTLDGSTPTMESDVFVNGEIEISAENNILTRSRFEDGVIIETTIKEFTFEDTFETAHDGYGNNRDAHWVLNYDAMTHFTFDFTETSFIESYDEITVMLPNGETEKLTDFGVREGSYDIYGTTFRIHFVTDVSVDNSYGFEGIVTYIESFESSAYYIEEEVVYHQVGQEFTDTVEFVTMENDVYYATTITNLDIDTLGTYQISYEIYNSNDELVDTLLQTVHIGDFIAPVITLTDGDIILEAGTEFVDPGYTVVEISEDLEVMIITGTVDTNTLGNYFITYQITDGAGNDSLLVTRKVTVVDTTKPVVTLNPGIDTIILGKHWFDTGVIATDSFDPDVTISVTNPVDKTVVGKYIVFYTVEDSEGNKTIINRIVHVVEETPTTRIEIDCGIPLTSFVQGSSVTTPVCSYNDVQLESDLQTSIIVDEHHTYEIYYIVTIDEKEYTIRSFAFIVPSSQNTMIVYAIEDKRRETL